MHGVNIPPGFFELPTDTVHVLCLNLAEQRAMLAAGLHALDPSELNRAARYTNAWHGQRYACSRSFLRHVLGRFLQQAPADIVFNYGTYGKPTLEGIDFSLSHCGDWLALAVSYGRRIGIDLENRVEHGGCLDVARQCFSPRELTELAQGKDMPQAFCAIWVRKEAVVKAAGRGLDTLQAFCTRDSVVSLPDEQGLPMQWHVGSLPGPAGHHLALAVEGNQTFVFQLEL
jgi:4'-phosphopantetheinyl transferase